MVASFAVKAILGAVGIVGAGGLAWTALTLYSQPLQVSRRADVVQGFLADALAGDSAALADQAITTQPVRWALAAARQDSAALREWVNSGGRVALAQRGDTLWVTLRRNRSSDHCSFLSSLTAALLADSGGERFVYLSASCPRASADDHGVR